MYRILISKLFLCGALVAVAVACLPWVVSADSGLMVCAGNGCMACHLRDLLSLFLEFLIMLGTFIATLILMWAGYTYVTAAGNHHKIEEATGAFKTVVVGFIIMLCGFLIVHTIMQVLVVGSIFGSGNWYDIPCVPNPLTYSAGGGSTGGGGGGATTTGSGIASTTGQSAIVDFAARMQAASCIYNQALRNGCQGNPGYTDCSDLVDVAYRNAGCRSPGRTSAAIAANGTAVGDQSTLRPGDALAYPGHVVICQNVGCTSVIHASGTGRNIVTGNSSYYLSRSDVRVVRTSDYCN